MPAPRLQSFLSPKSIAIIGASRFSSKIGHQVLVNLIDSGFKGPLYPINPNTNQLLNLKCYPTVHDIKKPIDLAIVVTPAPLVSTTVTECAQNSIKNIIILSTGFAESGLKGQILQTELEQTVRKYNLNVVGPNCLGCLSTKNKLNATFGPQLPQSGPVMIVTQSGAILSGILDWAKRYSIGISNAITFGNRVDLDETDALEYAAADPTTKYILVYIDTFHDAAKFFSICARISSQKPVILLQGNKQKFELTQSFAKQTGVILASTMSEWLYIAHAFTSTPKSQTTSVTIISNAGGPEVLATDEAHEVGLYLPELQKDTKTRLINHLPHLNPHNPLDLRSDATPESYLKTLQILEKDKTIHNLVIMITPQASANPTKIVSSIIQSKIHQRIPVACVLIGSDQVANARDLLEKEGIITFDFPSPAIKTIALKARYDSTKERVYAFPGQKVAYISQNKKTQLTKLLNESLNQAAILKVLHEYNLQMPKSALVDESSEIRDALAFVAPPAIAKTADITILHKSQSNGIYHHLMNAHEALLAFKKLQKIHPQVVIQQTVCGDVEVLVKAFRDPVFGPMISFGFGGVNSLESAHHISAGIPTSRNYLKELVFQTTVPRYLTNKEVQLNLLVDCLHKTMSILLDFENIKEIKLNPVIISKKHLYAVDAKITMLP